MVIPVYIYNCDIPNFTARKDRFVYALFYKIRVDSFDLKELRNLFPKQNMIKFIKTFLKENVFSLNNKISWCHVPIQTHKHKQNIHSFTLVIYISFNLSVQSSFISIPVIQLNWVGQAWEPGEHIGFSTHNNIIIIFNHQTINPITHPHYFILIFPKDIILRVISSIIFTAHLLTSYILICLFLRTFPKDHRLHCIDNTNSGITPSIYV